MSAVKRTNLNSVVDLRNAVDENLATSLSALGYTQSFTLIDTKLALGYSTAIIAGGLFYVDKKFGFEKTYSLTVAAVVAYFAISAILWYFTSTAQYKNVKYVGYKGKKTNTITIATWTNKYDPIYNVKFTIGNKVVETKFEFMKVFDGMGFYKEEELTKLIRGELEKIGKKDL